jgi:hypothetical protein
VCEWKILSHGFFEHTEINYIIIMPLSIFQLLPFFLLFLLISSYLLHTVAVFWVLPLAALVCYLLLTAYVNWYYPVDDNNEDDNVEKNNESSDPRQQ